MQRFTGWVVVGIAVTLVSCGGGQLTASQYAEAVEDEVRSMVVRFDEADAAWEAEQPTREAALRYWAERLEIRRDFLGAIEALDPPPEVAEMHARALSVFERITEADVAVAGRVAEYGEVTTHDQWMDTPEGQAAMAVLEEVYAFCRSSQDEFDATADRKDLEDVPWLPAEMRDVIKVAFGCPP